MPPSKNKVSKRKDKHPKNTVAANSIENYIDTPAKRTRSASGRMTQEKMAATNEDQSTVKNNSLTTIDEAATKEGFVAGMIEQINNSPHATPIKGSKATSNAINAGQVKEKQSTVSNEASMITTKEHDDGSIHTSPRDTDMAVANTTGTPQQLTEIFTNLNSTMKGIQDELRRLNTVQQEHVCKVSTLEFVQKDEVQSMRLVQAKLDSQQETIDMLINHVTKQDQRISELTAKQNDSQARSMRKNLVITGIPETTKENCGELASGFFTKELGIRGPIEIKIAHRMGLGKNRPMVVKLANIDDKQVIFQNTQKLRGSNYFVTEQLPEELAENKKLQQRIKGQNKALPVEEQLLVNVKRDRVLINNEVYHPPVTAPSALTWLAKTDEEKKQIKRAKVQKGDINTQTSSTFISYSAEVQSTREVQQAYDKVFTLEPRATHIVCAYLLPGRNFPSLQGGVNDREFGASRQLLRKMQTGGYFHRAVFVARYYGGTHLGAERFRIYKEVAQAALDKLPPPKDKRLNLQQLLHGAPVQAPTHPPFVFQPPLIPPIRAPPPSLPTTTTFTRPIAGYAQSQDYSWEKQTEQEQDHSSLDDSSQEEDNYPADENLNTLDPAVDTAAILQEA